MERLTEYNQKLRGYFYPYCFQEDTCAGLGCEKPDCRFSEKACKRLGQYEDTGLMPEEVQELKEELEKYRAVGTVEESKALKAKAVPKKSLEDELYDDRGICPHCTRTVGQHQNYCWSCGQHLDWT